MTTNPEHIIFRRATRKDLVDIIRLLADDELGQQREAYKNPLPESYYKAFERIDADINNYLMVVETGEKIVGTLQLTILNYLTYQGGRRALIEGVRIDSSCRDKGLGTKLFQWAIQKAKEQNCHLVQLTTDKKRPEALAFYTKLGFIPSHEGLKLHLD